MMPKFRVWDEENKRFLDEEEFIIIPNGRVLVGDWMTGNDFSYGYDEPERFILMQSTGLKDRNGVEIFEGDIVDFEDSDGGYEYQNVVINTGIVEYGDLGFYFTNRVAVEMDDFYIKDGRCDDVEVIGNICKNKELLEAMK